MGNSQKVGNSNTGGHRDISGYVPKKCEDKSRVGNPEAGAPQWKKKPEGKRVHGRDGYQIINGERQRVYSLALNLPYDSSRELQRIGSGPIKANVLLARPFGRDEAGEIPEMANYAQLWSSQLIPSNWTEARIERMGSGGGEKVRITPEYGKSLILSDSRVYVGDTATLEEGKMPFRYNPNADIWVRKI